MAFLTFSAQVMRTKRTVARPGSVLRTDSSMAPMGFTRISGSCLDAIRLRDANASLLSSVEETVEECGRGRHSRWECEGAFIDLALRRAEAQHWDREVKRRCSLFERIVDRWNNLW